MAGPSGYALVHRAKAGSDQLDSHSYGLLIAKHLVAVASAESVADVQVAQHMIGASALPWFAAVYTPRRWDLRASVGEGLALPYG